ncbi:DUF2851 family protein [Lentisphaerota bacterium WC36G]|nr:DUF2851 family protein [Lentisphaerae bacterium WC36]
MKEYYRCKIIDNCANFSMLKAHFIKLGEKRFKRFATNQTKDIISTGKNEALLKAFFCAAGYKKNQLNFLELFDRFNCYPNEIREKYFEAILWGESGLLPDPVAADIDKNLKDFFQNIWQQWWRIRQPTTNKINWIKTGIRPQNYPERRIAAICSFIQQFSLQPFNFFYDEINSASDIKIFEKRIYNLIQQNDPLWDNFYNFSIQTPQTTAVFGKNRANDFIINGLLPTLYGQTLLPKADNEKYSENLLTDRSKALNLWLSMNNGIKNKITIEIANRCHLNAEQAKIISKSNACNQGAIELYKEYCSPCLKNCTHCKVEKYL